MQRSLTITALFLFLGPFSARAQEPSAEAVSLMNLSIVPGNGSFLADGLCLVFPPEGEHTWELVFRDPAGAVKGKAQMQVQGWTQYGAFDGLGSLGVPVVQLADPGDYVMSVEQSGKAITSLRFTLEVEESGDPFNPRKTYTREGPWRSMAFLSSPTGKPDRPMQFHFWTCFKEIPKTGNQFPKATVAVLRDGERIAEYQQTVSIAGMNWRKYSRNLVAPVKPRGSEWLSLEKLQSVDGEYLFVIESDGQAIKTFPLSVRDGKVVPHPRTAFDTKPHTDYLVPKWIDRSSGSTGSFVQHDVFWVESTGGARN